jgi:hypothetical protein
MNGHVKCAAERRQPRRERADDGAPRINPDTNRIVRIRGILARRSAIDSSAP